MNGAIKTPNTETAERRRPLGSGAVDGSAISAG